MSFRSSKKYFLLAAALSIGFFCLSSPAMSACFSCYSVWWPDPDTGHGSFEPVCLTLGAAGFTYCEEAGGGGVGAFCVMGGDVCRGDGADGIPRVDLNLSMPVLDERSAETRRSRPATCASPSPAVTRLVPTVRYSS